MPEGGTATPEGDREHVWNLWNARIKLVMLVLVQSLMKCSWDTDRCRML